MKPAATDQAQPPDDLTGRDRLATNVAASWAGHLVFIVAGFIMPRQIDHHIGQVGLGVWDFGWSAVNYFYLAQIGVGVSVNRYVARYRARGDDEAVGRLISSVLILQLCAAAIVLLATAASAAWLPRLFGARLEGDADVARVVIALLGVTIAIRTAVQAFSGVVTGCHRWDLHNLLNSTAYGATVAAMIAALAFGGGLVAMSVVYLAGTIVNEIARIVLAYRVCPELRVSFGRASYEEARGLLAFGAKLSSIDVVKVITGELTSMLVLGQIGIATLAVYSRLGALIRHTENILAKFSLPLTPTASSLQGTGRIEDVRTLIITSTRFAAYLAWPILFGLAAIGGDVLEVWMGPRYEASAVLAVMAAGSMFPVTQQPIITILVGLNQHGRYAAYNIVASIAGFVVSLWALHVLHWELLGLASILLAVTNVASLAVAVDTCRRLDISVRSYFLSAYGGPLVVAAPFGALLFALGAAWDGYAWLTLAAAALLTVFGLAPIYWRYVVPEEARAELTRRLSRITGQVSLEAEAQAGSR